MELNRQIENLIIFLRVKGAVNELEKTILDTKRKLFASSKNSYSVRTASTYSFDYKNISVAKASAMRQDFINYSLSLHGTPYVLGGENPERGLDCSSFVRLSAKKDANVDLPRTAYAQYESSVKIPFF